MAVITRTSQTVVCCHRGDPAVKGGEGPEPDWVFAAGQPVTATRFEVRCLSPDELRAADGVDGYLRGLVSIDGAPVVVADLTDPWKREIGNLIGAVTMCPFFGLLSRSRESASTTATDGV